VVFKWPKKKPERPIETEDDAFTKQMRARLKGMDLKPDANVGETRGVNEAKIDDLVGKEADDAKINGLYAMWYIDRKNDQLKAEANNPDKHVMRRRFQEQKDRLLRGPAVADDRPARREPSVGPGFLELTNVQDIDRLIEEARTSPPKPLHETSSGEDAGRPVQDRDVVEYLTAMQLKSQREDKGSRRVVKSKEQRREDYEETKQQILSTTAALGATGTLGRQVVRQFLNAGYSVRCLIRNRADRPFSFLVDWGATVVEGSLVRKESLPTALIGIHTVIDCATARPEESIYGTDWEGKLAFVQCCEQMEIQRYVFMSIKDCDKFPDVPGMQIKYLMEKLLAKSKMRTTVLRTSGYFQPLVAQYAVSILDDQPVWSDEKSESGIAYIDSQDCARMIAAAVSKERTVGKTITVTGPKVWTSQSLIELCEQLSGKRADVNDVSPLVVKATAAAASCFLWSLDIADRLRFVETQGAKNTDMMTDETYALIGVEKGSSRNLEEYIGEYYRRIMKMLEVGDYDDAQDEEDDPVAKAAAAASAVQEDVLPPGQLEEKEVSVVMQREKADSMQKYFEDNILADMDDSKYEWFGIVPVAEVVNGRAAMMGFMLGLFTEWATDVSVTKQIDELVAIFSAPS